MRSRAKGVLAVLALAALPLPALPQTGSAQEREVTLEGFEGLLLHGTFSPSPRLDIGPAPAVLLLPGSGPTDRNGNQPPLLVTDLLKQLSERLTTQGFSVLRFDKRAARTYASHWPAEVEQQGDFFRWEAFVGDATAALAWLQKQPGVDKTRTAVLGHSEGGLIALQMGADLAGTPEAPTALVLVGTAAQRLDLVLRDQVEASLARQGVPEETRAEFRAELERAVTSVVTEHTVPEDLHPGLRALFPANALPLLCSTFTLEPTELAQACRGPVLVVGAAMDVQVPAAGHLEPLAKALASRAEDSVERLLVPGASHNLKAVATETEPGFAGPVVREALDGITGFLQRVLGR